MGEFELIRRYFQFSTAEGDLLELGVGDDCALLNIPPNNQLAVTCDTLVAGVHFPADGPAGLIAHRALRVNLSDLAAMGAEPLGFFLALTLPECDDPWLASFSEGLAFDAARFNCPLMGGDTTRGPLSMTLTALGATPRGQALKRAGAREGERIFVTGCLGDARAGLLCIEEGRASSDLVDRYWQPTPQLTAGILLRNYASAALDISDGLLQDVGHIASASGLEAVIFAEQLPLSKSLLALVGHDKARLWGLSAGDDYELCFSVPAPRVAAMAQALSAAGISVTEIGQMRRPTHSGRAVRCIDAQGRDMIFEAEGYDHFAC